LRSTVCATRVHEHQAAPQKYRQIDLQNGMQVIAQGAFYGTSISEITIAFMFLNKPDLA
jgi:hypothetical protein